jgi:Pentapeptide repeats (8 copies)
MAIDETNAQVTRIGLTFVGTAAFCLLSLFSPDSALLGGIEKINVPLAGPVSFFGFILLGPVVLMMLRVYLQIYVEHSNRLERLGQSMLAGRAPTLVPLKNPLMRLFSGLTFYLLLPLALMAFAWKAAVFPAWGSGLLCVAVGVIASHAMLPLGRVSWRSKALLSVIAAIMAAIIVAGVMFFFEPQGRRFELRRANLSNQWLEGVNLYRANLTDANLMGADLRRANLQRANLTDANLSSANLEMANLYQANLNDANLIGTKLLGANLSAVELKNANLIGARGLGQPRELGRGMCGNANTKLPEGFTLKPCPEQQ